MKKFEQFKIENQEIIFGGKLYITTCGTEVCDVYDNKTGTIVYL